jgi:hypothetical protein
MLNATGGRYVKGKSMAGAKNKKSRRVGPSSPARRGVNPPQMAGLQKMRDLPYKPDKKRGR